VSFAARMIGAGESGVFLTRFTAQDAAVGYTSDVTITANTNGTLTVVGNGNIYIGTITPNPGYYSPTTAAIGSNYQIRITPTAGSFSTGTVNTWLTLSSARVWSVSGTRSTTFTIEVRNTSSATVLATTTSNQIDVQSTYL